MQNDINKSFNKNCFDMCVNQRWISNKYTGRQFLVKCGKCEACKQEKAAIRSNRIRNEAASDSSRHPLFVSLTYDRSSCPFVYFSDLQAKKNPLPIYREHESRRVRQIDGSYKDRRVFKKTKLDEIVDPDYSSLWFEGGKLKTYLRFLKHRHGKIGVCYFPDVQKFLKRLRSNLIRVYNYDKKFSVFYCFEYGETTFRPHIHLLFFIPPSDEAIFRSCILTSWPFADKCRTGQYIELCRDDAAGYVSSYVNCGSDFPSFLAENFKPKHSHSKFFGHGLKSFALDKILKNVDSGDMRYSTTRNIDGIREVVRLPVPKYVINKFFPLFKGYSRLTDSEIRDVLQNGFDFTQLWQRQGHDTIIGNHTRFSEYDIPNYFRLVCNTNYRDDRNIDYSFSDIRKISVRLNNAYKRYHQITGKNLYDYAIDFTSVWRCYKSTCQRVQMEDQTEALQFKYDNILAYLCGSVKSLDLDYSLRSCSIFVTDPNLFPRSVNQSIKMTDMYHRYLKTKKVNNIVYSQKCDYY